MNATSQIRCFSREEFATKTTLVMRGHEYQGGLDQTTFVRLWLFLHIQGPHMSSKRDHQVRVSMTRRYSTTTYSRSRKRSRSLTTSKLLSMTAVAVFPCHRHRLLFLPSQAMPCHTQYPSDVANPQVHHLFLSSSPLFVFLSSFSWRAGRKRWRRGMKPP